MSGRFPISTGQMILCIVMGVMALAGIVIALYITRDLDDLGNTSEKKGAKTPISFDLVSVVRCAECIHRERRKSCKGRRKDWFCADGQRREGE